MKALSKFLGAGALALILGVFGLVATQSVFAIEDQDPNDLNRLTKAIAGSELVQIETESILVLDVLDSGNVVTSITAAGVTTTTAGADSTTNPKDIGTVVAGTAGVGYSNQVVKSNNASGYNLFAMACNTAAGTDYTTAFAANVCNGTYLGNATTSTAIPGVAGTALTIAGTNMGVWGFQKSVSTNGSTAVEPAGDFFAVPAFSDVTAYGTSLTGAITSAGATAVNTKYSVLTNNTLPAGTYNTSVIYTAVAL